MEKIQSEYVPLPEFNPANVAKASSAAEGLCRWVLAMELYDRTAKVRFFFVENEINIPFFQYNFHAYFFHFKTSHED